MDNTLDLLEVVTAVFIGNCLTVWFFYFFWESHKRQKMGLDPYGVSFGAMIGGLAGPLISAAIIYFRL